MSRAIHPILIITVLVFGLAIQSLSSPAFAAAEARLDRSRIGLGETLILRLETDNQRADRPDLSPLEADFDILNVSTSQQTNIINGQVDARLTWTLTLSPKRQGQLTVPALTIAGERTTPQSVEVVEGQTQGMDIARDIQVETSLTPESGYVQGMIRYTVRIFTALRLSDASLTEPEIENAIVQRLGEDQSSVVQKDNRTFQLYERTYAIFPQESGTLTIPEVVLDAQIPVQQRPGASRRDTLFGNLFDTHMRQVRLRGEARTVQVAPRPDGIASRDWLPAQDLTLREDWLPAGGSVRVGEPLTRTVRMRAIGLTGAQLPDIPAADLEGTGVYPDQASAETTVNARILAGERTQAISYVPSRPGLLTIPAIAVSWWDVTNSEVKTATLPAREIQVLPADGTASTGLSAQPPAPPASPRTPDANGPGGPEFPGSEHQGQGNARAQQNTPSAEALPSGGPSEGSSRQSTSGTAPNSPIWVWVSAGLAVLWLGTAGLWFQERRRRVRPADPGSPNAFALEQNHHPLAGSARKLFLQACEEGDAPAARRHLLAWSRYHWRDHPPKGMDDVAARLEDNAARSALGSLQKALYGPSGSQWDGTRLAETLKALPPSGKNSKDPRGALPTLYPDAAPQPQIMNRR